MSSYNISPTLNKNKVFLLQKSELENRLDPQFYKQEYKNNFEKIKRVHHKRIGDIVKFSSETWNQKDHFSHTFPYIEISEIDIMSGEIQNISNVEIKNAASRAKMIVREDDIIISTTRPNRGAIALIKKTQDCSIASTGFSVIRNIINHEVIREYLFAVLRQHFILKQFEQRSSGGNYPAITQEELSNVIIPLPDIAKQNKIIDIFHRCLEQKKQNDAEAEKLLTSIDDYLLKELGITLPAPNEDTLKNRMFSLKLSELSGNRFDPYFYQEKFKVIITQLLNGKFPISNLKKKSNLITSGATPLSGGNAYTEDKTIGIPFIRSGEISNIDFETSIYIKPEIHNSILKSSKLKKGDLLIAIVGATIGEVGVYAYDKEANINQAIALVRLNDQLNSDYVRDFLKSKCGQSILDRIKRPVARANINLDEIGIISIPVPPLAKQKEIADHINAIRQQAQDLKKQTQLALQKANEKIEQIILKGN